MSNLDNKIALITGASSGIGAACARKFAEQGVRLILAARRTERLEKLAAELSVETHLIQLDVRDRKAVEKVIYGLPSEWENIDILVNNAGLSRGLHKLHEGNIDSWEEMIDTNVKGLLYVSRAVIPGMVARGRGHIINIGSIAGHEVYPGGNVYCATKHAVDALSKGMRIDLVDTPIRVSTVDPGLVETEFSQVRFYGDKERAKGV
ncbi:MAG: SDR family NAD(P)-dependent oxidoreductase, partial [Candidatus Zixiibacteriota bacterium]